VVLPRYFGVELGDCEVVAKEAEVWRLFLGFGEVGPDFVCFDGAARAWKTAVTWEDDLVASRS
jgi:hypothetical protein